MTMVRAPAHDDTMALDDKASRLRRWLEDAGQVLVAMSAGVDSGLLAHEAHRALGDRFEAVTVHAESSPAWETDDAVAFAARHGLRHRVVLHSELADPAYVRNDASRCFHCRKNMAAVLLDAAASRPGTVVVMGYTLSDFAEYRPGYEAARQAGVRSPLVECGFTKDDVRALARARGLENADRPSNACLSSRIPYGEPVTLERLRQVEAAESALRALGLAAVRVRHHGAVARIEVPPKDLMRVVQRAAEVEAAVRGAGFAFVALDLAGYRPGSLTALLPDDSLTMAR